MKTITSKTINGITLTREEIIDIIDECHEDEHNIDKCNNCPLAAECMAYKLGVTRYL